MIKNNLNLMKNLIISFLFLIISVTSYAEIQDTIYFSYPFSMSGVYSQGSPTVVDMRYNNQSNILSVLWSDASISEIEVEFIEKQYLNRYENVKLLYKDNDYSVYQVTRLVSINGIDEEIYMFFYTVSYVD